MSDRDDRALQIGFGIVSVVGTLIALASIHNRDSLGSIMFRRLFMAREEGTSDPMLLEMFKYQRA